MPAKGDGGPFLGGRYEVWRGKFPNLLLPILGVRLAADFGITLIGFVRERRINIYTHSWRVTAASVGSSEE